jgi:subtilase family serine protease
LSPGEKQCTIPIQTASAGFLQKSIENSSNLNSGQFKEQIVIRRLTLLFSTVIAMVLGVNVVAQAQPQSLLTRHVREATVSGRAQPLGHLPAAQSMRLVLVLPLRDQEALDSFLKELYDPSSPSYRQFLTVEEFTAKFGPTQEDYDAVINFAEAHGLTVAGTSRNRVNLDVKGSVASIEEAFHLTLGIYQHPTEDRTFFAPDREPTPDLAVQLWHISGLDNFSIPRPAVMHRELSVRPNATTGSGPSASFLGSDMRAAYYGGTLTGSGQTLGLLEYAGTDLADLTTYFTNAHETNNVPVTLKSTDGTSVSCLARNSCDDTEQTIDMTQAIGMAPGLSSLVMYVGSSDSAIFNAMATASPLNPQLSSSWTWYPADPGTDNPYFTEFATQGQNLFQAAGDSGAWTASGSGAEIFPADDVYVTSVGGTDLDTSSAGGPWSSESAWSNGGGGISPDKYTIPSWQTSAAGGCSSCSKNYRNGPDVSANANYTFYVCADQTTCTANEYGGTSFAAPMWAGYLALVNEQALLNGNKAVGFINPSLYSIGAGSSYDADFHDITSGSNGFSATTGYDLATGWGSPNGSGLINALAGTSSSPSFTISASPTSVSVVQGKSGTSTITTAVSGGFDAAIAFSATGQPAGVTVTFNPTSIAAPGAGTSTMTMAVASTTATGTYTITVTGTGGGLTETCTVTLTVTTSGSADFTISASPTTITVAKGASGTSTITTTALGSFSSAITLSAKGQGPAQKVTFTPNPIAAPGTGTSTMTVTVGNANLGNHTITITGKGGGKTHTTTVVLTIIK